MQSIWYVIAQLDRHSTSLEPSLCTQMTAASCAELLNERRQAFASLADLLKQRDRLLHLQIDTLASFGNLSLDEADLLTKHERVSKSI